MKVLEEGIEKTGDGLLKKCKEEAEAKKAEIEKIEKDKNMRLPDWYKGWVF